jgi:ABC-type glutathione transport system ATPase component
LAVSHSSINREIKEAVTQFSQSVLRAEGVSKIYAGADAPVEALRGVSLTLLEGEFVAVVG